MRAGEGQLGRTGRMTSWGGHETLTSLLWYLARDIGHTHNVTTSYSALPNTLHHLVEDHTKE